MVHEQRLSKQACLIAPSLRGVSGLEAALADAVARARAAWPGIALEDVEFVRHVATHLASGFRRDAPPPDVTQILATLHAADLYLACACARGEATAIAQFERRFLPDVADALSRMDKSNAFVNDVAQLVRQKLLVSDGSTQPKIADYAGRGPLASWVRAAAVRTALSAMRQDRREVPTEDPLLNAPVHAQDPELDYIRDQYREEFRAAFREALDALTQRERNVLRLHLLDGLNIDQIGIIYGAHRSTVARWIARSRETLLDRMRSCLTAKLKLSAGEFNSLMALVRSHLDLSLHSFLRAGPDES